MQVLKHTSEKKTKAPRVDKKEAKVEEIIKVVSIRNESLFQQSLVKCRSDFMCKWTNPPPCPPVTDDQFERIKELGEGAFGRVMLVRHKPTTTLYASKILNKEHIIRSKCKDHVLTEKRVLQCVNFPFLIQLHFYYKDDVNLYLVLEYVEGGDLFLHLKQLKRFEEHVTKFYAAQVVLALEYLHFNELLYRDLKPENILVDRHGYVKVTDFGFVKFVPDRTWTICGTPEYMSPEIIQNQGYGICSDWWSLGILIFEMCCGYTPFRGREEREIFQNIISHRFTKSSRMSKDCADLVENLLQNDVRKRYGALKNGIMDITHHPWFYKTDWEAICARTLISPYVPSIPEAGATAGETVREEFPKIKTLASPSPTPKPRSRGEAGSGSVEKGSAAATDTQQKIRSKKRISSGLKNAPRLAK